MAEFAWVESASTQMEEAPRFSRTRFGDGYAQDAPDGLNPITQRWRVVFTDVENSVADAIVAFFRARAGATTGLGVFDWVPLWATGTNKILVKCPSWSRRHKDFYGTSDIEAVFEQVFKG